MTYKDGESVPRRAMPQDQPSVCIVSHNGYGAISGSGGFVGGVERQTSLLANWLAEHGHVVSFLTWSEGGAAEEMIGGVRVIKVCRAADGLPGLRFLHPKWTGLERAMAKADADVYYHNCSESVTGQVAWWCRRNRKRFVFSLASDADWNPHLPEVRRWHEKALYRYGLRNADTVIAQTETQRSMLQKYWNIDASVIPMPCESPDTAEPESAGREAGRVLWVGRVCSVKRLEWFLDVAEALPQFMFDLVGPFHDEPYANQIHQRASMIQNVVLHGRVDKSEVGQFYRQASILLCTSIYEGFPNTFLEAWSRGVPVVSSFDPDGIVESAGLGCFAAQLPEIIQSISKLFGDGVFYERSSKNGICYFNGRHVVERVLPQVAEALFGDRLVSDI